MGISNVPTLTLKWYCALAATAAPTTDLVDEVLLDADQLDASLRQRGFPLPALDESHLAASRHASAGHA